MKRSSIFQQSGFTLIEMMIVAAIIAILAAIAYPSYQRSILKSYRGKAEAEMMDLANRQQQYLMSNRLYYVDYPTLQAATNYSLPSDLSSRYTPTITADNSATPPTFTITLTATGAQAADKSTSGAYDYTVLTINEQNVKTPTGAWGN